MRRFVANRCLAVAVAALALGFASQALAQRNDRNQNQDQQQRNQDQQQRQDQNQDPAQPSQNTQSHIDKMAANAMQQCSQQEIDLANFALKHTQNEEVRRFAQKVIEDHTNLDNQLQRFTSAEGRGQPGNQTSAQPGTSAAAQPGTETAAQPAARPDATAGGDSNWKANDLETIRKDIASRVTASIERELAQYQASDFDRAYVGQQFWAHVVFIASATAGGNHVSPDLKQVVDQGAKTAQMHLDDCRKLIRDLSANVARSAGTTER
jgi:predicted outer membrane protein